jgi:CBS domain containing-hemolysin-like protein
MLQRNSTAPLEQDEEPPPRPSSPLHKKQTPFAPLQWLRELVTTKPQNDSSLREALEEIIEEYHEGGTTESLQEKRLISNILELQDLTVFDVMIPRADIIAIPIDIEQKDLFSLLSEKQFSRLPVYRENMDDIIGTVHIKDILAELAKGIKSIQIKDLIRSVPIVSPTLPVLDLLMQMQQTSKHMVMVVDEYGGIDGLITIGDLVESIVGEIDDEFQNEIQPTMSKAADGSIIVDARYDLDAFEEEFGTLLNEEEREEIDTIGGLVSAIAGRIPARGEILTHEESGLKFEILDADPRRVNKLKIHNTSIN